MVVISYSGKEANGKIVYYGPGLGGKTTNLEFIYDSVPASSRGKMVSMKTQTDRTLFFDFLPLDLGELGGFKTRFLLYTVPGQVFYNATRKLVLRGADAIAFIADSERGKMEDNKDSLANLEENLADYDLSLENIPWVIQYNKRDLADVYTVEELNKELNSMNVPYFEAVATEGVGVFETFRGLSRLLLEKLSEEIGQRMVIGRHFGRKQEQKQEQEQVIEVHEADEIQPVASQEVPVEAESLEIVSSGSSAEERSREPVAETEEVPLQSSEVVFDELEILPNEPVADSDAAETGAAESGAEESMGAASESEKETAAVSAGEEPEPLITHEEDRAKGFFSEAIESPPLEAEIHREEVLLSEEPSSTVAPDSTAEGQPKEVQRPSEEISEEVSLENEESRQASTEEPSEEEPSFLGIIRRNDVGVFQRKELSESTQSAGPAVQDSAEEQSLERVIEVPVQMEPGEDEKEIILTLRIRLKPVLESKEARSDEFLLDGISK